MARRMRRWGAPLLAALGMIGAGAAGAEAQARYTEHTLTADGSARPPATIEAAGWLTGHWEGEGFGSPAQEAWLPPVGGSMAGVFRLLDGDRVQFYEIMTIVEDEGSLVLRLKHFDPDLGGWEAPDETVDFPLLRVTPDTLWFDGMTIAREGPDGMMIWVAVESRGRTSEGEFVYRRVSPGS